MELLMEERGRPVDPPAVPQREPCPPLLLVIEDTQALSRAVGFLCQYLGVQIEAVGGQRDLRGLLTGRRPIAVLAPAEAVARDGYDVLRRVAEYDRDLPVMLVVARNSAQLGRIKAMEATLCLSSVRKVTTVPGMGDLADFLSEAGKRIARWPARQRGPA